MGSRTHVMPPPMLPQPPARALAVPNTLGENICVAQNWHGTNVAPNTPMKNLLRICQHLSEIIIITREMLCITLMRWDRLQFWPSLPLQQEWRQQLRVQPWPFLARNAHIEGRRTSGQLEYRDSRMKSVYAWRALSIADSLPTYGGSNCGNIGIINVGLRCNGYQ